MHEYRLSPQLRIAAAALAAHRGPGAAAVLLEGPPGAGKTSFGEHLSKVLPAELVFGQLHAWSDADELFVGVDVCAAVAGDATAVRQEGLLARAARLSQSGRVVLVLDEVDKTSERCEALLLDFLQSGRVPLRPGCHIQAQLERLVVVLTSNGQRELSDALLRRVRRVDVAPLDVETFISLAAEMSGAPSGIVRLVAREAHARGVSVQEAARAAHEAHVVAQSCADVREVLAAWLGRDAERRTEIRRAPLAAAVWAEVVAVRRHQEAAQ